MFKNKQMNSIRSYYHNDADYHTTASEQPLQTAMGSGKPASKQGQSKTTEM